MARNRHRSGSSLSEGENVAIAFAVIAADLFILFSGLNLSSKYYGFTNTTGFTGWMFYAYIVFEALLISFFAFVLHEMGHKVAAEAMGMDAEFRLSVEGLVVATITAIVGFLLAAPGATYFDGRGATDAEVGKTGAAGPIVNIVVGVAFLVVAIEYFGLRTFWGGILGGVSLISFLFAAFNLLPLDPLDGGKVWAWSGWAWGTLGVVSVSGLVLTSYLLA